MKEIRFLVFLLLLSSNSFAGWTYSSNVEEVYWDYSTESDPKLKIKAAQMWSPKGSGCPSDNSSVIYYVVKGDINKLNHIFALALTSLSTKLQIKFGSSVCDSGGSPVIWGAKLFPN